MRTKNEYKFVYLEHLQFRMDFTETEETSCVKQLNL